MKFNPNDLLVSESKYLNRILNKVSIVSNIPKDLIIKKGRKREVVIARHLYFYIANKKKIMDLSLGRIGSLVGKDHSTVLYGIDRIENDIDVNYIPTITILNEFGILSTVISQYKLSWKNIKLINLLKTNEKIEMNVIEEEYIPIT